MKTFNILAPCLAAMALTPSMLAAAEDGPGLVDVNLGLSLWTVVIFLALLFMLRRFAWGPILGMVEERENRIQAALDESAAARDEARRRLYLHVYRWPEGGTLSLSGARVRPTSAALLARPSDPIQVTQIEDGIEVRLTGAAPDPAVSVIAIDFEGSIEPLD